MWDRERERERERQVWERETGVCEREDTDEREGERQE